MSDKFVTRTGALMAVGALGAAAFLHAPDSNAFTGAHVIAHSLVEWGGQQCVTIVGVSPYNPTKVSDPTIQCTNRPDYEVSWAQWDQKLYISGQVVGFDVFVGKSMWVKCTLTINGEVRVVDYALNGEKDKASCLKAIE